MDSSFLFLGTGSSMGTPAVGCACPVCTSSSSFDKRLRPSGLLSIKHKKILIDVGPDFRLQALKYDIKNIDGVIISHAHYDHAGGIDELRVFYINSGRPLSCLLSKETFEGIQTRHPYFFKKHPPNNSLPAKFEFKILENDFGQVDFLDMPFTYMSYYQGDMKVNGFRVGNFAYVSDIGDYSDKIFEYLKGLDVLVLSALRKEESAIHLNIDQAVAFAKRAGAKQTWLTHMAHEVGHEDGGAMLPDGIDLSYDGLRIGLR